jgi:hypothetical protein
MTSGSSGGTGLPSDEGDNGEDVRDGIGDPSGVGGASFMIVVGGMSFLNEDIGYWRNVSKDRWRYYAPLFQARSLE